MIVCYNRSCVEFVVFDKTISAAYRLTTSAALVQNEMFCIGAALSVFHFGGAMEKMTVLTGVRMTPSQAAKLERLAENMRMPKNRLMGLLIDSAEAQALPAVSVRLEKRNRDKSPATVSDQTV